MSLSIFLDARQLLSASLGIPRNVWPNLEKIDEKDVKKDAKKEAKKDAKKRCKKKTQKKMQKKRREQKTLIEREQAKIVYVRKRNSKLSGKSSSTEQGQFEVNLTGI